MRRMRIPMEVLGQLATRFEVLLPHLNERQQRLALAVEARLLGHGGVRAVASSAELRAATDAARQRGAGVGFVPTMGALHAGHRSLLAAARRETGFVVASVFVNPLQFGPAEDLATYPRDREGDLAVLEGEGADLAFLPDEREVWPEPPEVRLHVGALGDRLEGASRPGHLDGVATVVAKLLHLVGPSRAYFGQKDAQQLAVVRRMVADLAFPNEIVACPTVREPDGLAVSSRNAYLLPDERQRATVVYRALEAGRAEYASGGRDPAAVEAAAREVLEDAPGVEPDYVALVDPVTFEPVKQADAGQVLATAARVAALLAATATTLQGANLEPPGPPAR
jgi:pantoate--beta-alanine ligase